MKPFGKELLMSIWKSLMIL